VSDNKVIVHKGRTVTIEIDLGIDISADTFFSEIRAEPTSQSPLICTWTVVFLTDGHDGKLKLTLDDSITGPIAANSGYMDLKRVTGSEPVPVFDEPLEVTFRGSVTL
jgi:hypothetical protein